MLQGLAASSLPASSSKSRRGDDMVQQTTQLTYLTQKVSKPVHAHIHQVKSLKYERTRLQFVAYKKPDDAEPDTLITHPLRKPTPSASLHDHSPASQVYTFRKPTPCCILRRAGLAATRLSITARLATRLPVRRRPWHG